MLLGPTEQKEAIRIAQQEGRSLVHPFDDPLVIAGNGTIGMEILKEVRCLLHFTATDRRTRRSKRALPCVSVCVCHRRLGSGRTRSSRRWAAAA